MRYSRRVFDGSDHYRDGATHNPDSDGNPNVFDVKRNDDGELWLNNDWTNPDNRWNLDNRVLFRLRNSLHFSSVFADSHSCRKRKGTHRAMNRFRSFAYKVSKNHARTCWVLKCDIRKFFASVDQKILMGILKSYIPDECIIAFMGEVISSFCSCCTQNTDIRLKYATAQNKCISKGLPLGNLTSQLLVNIYMNEFDQFVKHKLKARHYIRYADDFVILSADKWHLLEIRRYIALFLRERLRIELHPDKVSIRTIASGVDFLGWVHFPDHRVLRTSTKRRMLARTRGCDNENVIASYLGLLGHGNANTLVQPLLAKLKNLK